MNDGECRKNIFTKICNNHSWGGMSKSGPGSDVKNIMVYCDIVDRFLDKFYYDGAKIVGEIGCGDWSTTAKLNLSKYDSYIGIDIVPSMVFENMRKYGDSKHRFLCIDAVVEDIPKVDVLIIKDVLQHLSINSIFAILNKILVSTKYAIITNDIKKEKRNIMFKTFECWRPIHDRGVLNENIKDGGTRPLDLKKEPFCLKPNFSERYYAYLNEATFLERYTKEVLIFISKGISKV